jgi:hypothetical protein
MDREDAMNESLFAQFIGFRSSRPRDPCRAQRGSPVAPLITRLHAMLALFFAILCFSAIPAFGF